MKRNIKGAALLCLIFTLLLEAMVSAKEVNVNISVNDKVINFTKETGIPFADERERTFVPIRVVMESMGILVDWNQERKEAILKDEDTTVIVTIDKDIILVNGTEVKSDVPAIGLDGRTYLPIRIVAESFGAKVDWDQESMTVLISREEEQEELEEIEEDVPEGIEEEPRKTNALVRGSNINIRYSYTTQSQKEETQAHDGQEILVFKVRKTSGRITWCEFDYNGNKRWICADYVEILNWDNIEIEEDPYGDRLTEGVGIKTNQDGRVETYYDWPMEGKYNWLWQLKDENGNLKYPKEEYPAWIDEYGFKRFGPYFVVAACYDVNPRGTLVNTSAGTAVVADTGGFRFEHPTWIDIATNWERELDDALK